MFYHKKYIHVCTLQYIKYTQLAQSIIECLTKRSQQYTQDCNQFYSTFYYFFIFNLCSNKLIHNTVVLFSKLSRLFLQSTAQLDLYLFGISGFWGLRISTINKSNNITILGLENINDPFRHHLHISE